MFKRTLPRVNKSCAINYRGSQKGFSHLQDLSVSDRIVLTLQMALPFQKQTQVKVGAPEQQPTEIRADVRMNKTGCSKGFGWISHGTGFIKIPLWSPVTTGLHRGGG